MSALASPWLLFTFLCLAMHAFFTSAEMACVSFNRVRMEYYVSQGNQRAVWLSRLMKNPSQLFGTTLLGVNLALQLGSECSRQWYEALGWSPDWAPFTQILLVLLFAELSPMLAARRHPEHLALLGVPIIYVLSRVAAPVIWLFGLLTSLLQKWTHSQEVETDTYLSRDELYNIIAEKEESQEAWDKEDDFNRVVANLFSLRDRAAQGIMERLSNVHMLPSNCTVAHLLHILRSAHYSYVPIYHRSRNNIVGVVHPRDLISTPDQALLRDHARPPWFLTRNTKIMEILRQFRQNNQTVAVVLNDRGQAIGTLSLNDLLAQVFGRNHYGFQITLEEEVDDLSPNLRSVVERSLPADMTIDEFNRQFSCSIESEASTTLAELFKEHLGHAPDPGDSVRIQGFEFIAKEGSLMGIHTIDVRSL